MKLKNAAGERGVPAAKRGFIKLILLIIVALLVISYFGINLRQLVSSPTTQDNVSYVASTTVAVWNDYLKGPVTYLWNKIFLDLIWLPAVANLKNQKWEAPSTSAATSTPDLPGLLPVR